MTDQMVAAIKACCDCGIDPERTVRGTLSRGRCRPCYRRHVKALKRAGAFEALNAAADEPVAQRLARRSGPAEANGCIPWTGGRNSHGYGQIGFAGQQHPAHRVAYEEQYGPIPEGLRLDHLCHNRDDSCAGGPTCPHRRCINPEHLEPVTDQENAERGRAGAREAARTHCPQDHPYDEANTYARPDGSRTCRACSREHGRVYKAKRRGRDGGIAVS